MNAVKSSLSTLAMALVLGGPHLAFAQEAVPSTETEGYTELPGLVVEAPAKRNVKKAKLPEDQEKRAQDQVQKLTEKFTSRIEKATEAKEKEIMEV